MAICGALFLALSGMSALAGSKSANSGQSAPPQGNLPGVDGTYSIVTPLPPEPDNEPRSGSFGQFKVGNFDVRVSGQLIFDVGVGPLSRSKR